MADEPTKDKTGLAERLNDAFAAVQVARAVIGTPGMPVQQPPLAPPPTPPAIIRQIDRESPAASVDDLVGQAADNMEHVYRDRRARAMEQMAEEARPKVVQYPPAPPARDAKRQQDRSRSRER